MGDKEKNKKATYWILGVVIVVIILSLFILNSSLKSTGEVTNENPLGENKKTLQKQECPYECCSEGTYYEKSCSLDYECISNSCRPIDSDGDSLTDIEEKQIGTGPYSFDTDKDTLSDYQEVKVLGTNPLNRNTDNDRYYDAEDINPLEKNSAEIEIDIIKNEGYWNEELKSKLYPVLGCLILYGVEASFGEITGFISQACSYLLTGTPIINIISEDISYRDVEIKIQNIGDDYTSYTRYRMNVYIQYENNQKELFDIKEINLDRLNPGEYNIDKTTYVFKVEDYTTKALKNIWDGKTGDKIYLFEFENLDYERF
jgi:hypothetical protein